MDFINLHTSVLDSEEYVAATVAQRGTWLSIYRYCAGQENGGRIEGAKAWSDRTWLKICGVSLREVGAGCRLWGWEGETLVLRFYNLETEANVNRLRSQAAAGAHARWHRSGIPSGMPEGMPSGIPQGTPEGNGVGNAKGKERERKEREYRAGGQVAPASGHSNGTKTHTGQRKRKPGSVLPSEQPSPVCERMISIGLLFRRQAAMPWTAKEVEAFQQQRLADCPLADFDAQLETMGGYYGAKIPREIDFRRRELLTLLNNWPGELDKARAFNRDREPNDGITKV